MKTFLRRTKGGVVLKIEVRLKFLKIPLKLCIHVVKMHNLLKFGDSIVMTFFEFHTNQSGLKEYEIPKMKFMK